MLFHSSKKPVELQIIHLNKSKQKRQHQFKDAIESKQDKQSCLSCFRRLIKSNKESYDDKFVVKDDTKNIYLLDFDGDIKASAVTYLREEISTIISVAQAGDEVVVRLESGGGQVNAYGLAAAQLERIKMAGLTLTVCVDKIAASGGYMMACVADKIIVSDFGIIGSVGVVSQLPNFHELMKKHNIGYEMFTAGEYKRTVTVFGENTDEDRAKYQQEVNRIHELFKEFVKKHRPSLDVDKIATGEFWFGKDALTLNLVDDIGTSDAYILGLMSHYNVFAVQSRSKPTLVEKLGLADRMEGTIDAMIDGVRTSMVKLIDGLNRP